MPLPQLPQDKANHFLYGSAIAVVVLLLAVYAGRQGHDGLWIYPLLASAIAGALKEVRDRFTPGSRVELTDALATADGGAVVAAAVYLSGA